MKNKALLGLAVVSVIAYTAWHRTGGDDREATHANLALDRVWIDHMPKHDRDTIQVFVAITEEPFGIFQATSQWKGSFELFRYESHGNEFRIMYGQTGEREKVTTSATKCSKKDWDYCLELDGASRGVKSYYSREGWEIDGAASVDDIRVRIDSILQQR